jgi:glycerol kinase
LAGLAVGFWDSKETIAKKWRSQRLYLPNMNHMKTHELYDGWQKAVQACMSYSVEK